MRTCRKLLHADGEPDDAAEVVQGQQGEAGGNDQALRAVRELLPRVADLVHPPAHASEAVHYWQLS